MGATPTFCYPCSLLDARHQALSSGRCAGIIGWSHLDEASGYCCLPDCRCSSPLDNAAAHLAIISCCSCRGLSFDSLSPRHHLPLPRTSFVNDFFESSVMAATPGHNHLPSHQCLLHLHSRSSGHCCYQVDDFDLHSHCHRRRRNSSCFNRVVSSSSCAVNFVDYSEK